MAYLLDVGRHHSNPCNSSPMLSLQFSYMPRFVERARNVVGECLVGASMYMTH